MKTTDKKVVDLAKAIFTQHVAEFHMAPGSRRETDATRQAEFRKLATRAIDAANGFYVELAAQESEGETEGAVI